MKTNVIIQARMTSTRLPGKVMMELNGKPVLLNIVERLSKANKVDEIIIATSCDSSDNQVEQLCQQYRIPVFRGDHENVLDRFYKCAITYNTDTVVRCTADNALVDAGLLDQAIESFELLMPDYLYYREGLPLGMCFEVFSFGALEKAYKEATSPECLEHVTPYIRQNPNMFKVIYYPAIDNEDHSDLRFTMDTEADYQFVRQVYSEFSGNDFEYKDVIHALEMHNEWKLINKNIVQNKVQYIGET